MLGRRTGVGQGGCDPNGAQTGGKQHGVSAGAEAGGISGKQAMGVRPTESGRVGGDEAPGQENRNESGEVRA